MLIFFMSVCLFSGSAAPVFSADSISDREMRPESRAVLEAGLNCFYNSDYNCADAKFRKYAEMEPDDPVGELRLSLSWLFRLRHEQKKDAPKLEDGPRADFFKLLDVGINKADKKIGNGKQIDFYQYVEANLLYTKAVLLYGCGSWWAAKNTLQSAVAVASASKYRGAKFLLGLTNYRASSHPVVTTLFGIPNNDYRGRELIFESVALDGGMYADDVWFVILKIITDKKNACQYTADDKANIHDYLHRKYPGNEAFSALGK